MRPTKNEMAMIFMRVVLGIVVLAQSFEFLFGADAIRAFAHTGLPDAVRLILGWSEVAAAALFLLPQTLVIGAWSLLMVFFGAVVLHLAHGKFDIGGLLVYSMVVIVVLAHRGSRRARTDAAVS